MKDLGSGNEGQSGLHQVVPTGPVLDCRMQAGPDLMLQVAGQLGHAPPPPAAAAEGSETTTGLVWQHGTASAEHPGGAGPK